MYHITDPSQVSWSLILIQQMVLGQLNLNNTIGFQSDIFQDIPSKTYHIYITYLCIGYQCVIFTSKLLDPLVKNKDGEGYSNS